jgi:GNAT superfamily N-acetyltransferase
MADTPVFPVRLMTPADLDQCMALKELIGWNQLREDWEQILRLRPDGCFVACQGDRIVGTATTTAYGNAFGWVGMVIAHPDCRRCGIGRSLLERCIDSLAHCDAVRLDATPAGKQLYDRLGFVDEYELGRYSAQSPFPADVPDVPGLRIGPLQTADLPAVVAFDTPFFGIDRSAVLATWQKRTPGYAWIARRDGQIAGYCLGRPGANFATVGPVVALEEGIARALVARALAAIGPRPVAIDAFEHTPAFLDWLARTGFVRQRPFIRMYRGRNTHPGNPAGLYAVCGPEVG